MVEVRFQVLSLTGHANLAGIDYNDIIADVHMRSKYGLVFPAQQLRNMAGESAQGFPFCINEKPFLFDILFFRSKCSDHCIQLALLPFSYVNYNQNFSNLTLFHIKVKIGRGVPKISRHPDGTVMIRLRQTEYL